jgi:hypothetical protein
MLREFHFRNPGRRGNALNVSHRHSAAFPRSQDLANTLVDEAVPCRNSLATPAQNEVQLNQPPLKVRAVVSLERWHLAWETHSISAYRFAELIDPQATQLALVKCRDPRAAALIPASAEVPGRVGAQLKSGVQNVHTLSMRGGS